jgi:alcohol dehydrogenase (cytochrome c)
MISARPQNSQAERRSAWLLVQTFCFALGVLSAATMTSAADNAQRLPSANPSANALLNAGQDDADWILPAKTYSGNRFTALTQIDKTNVASLRMAWRTNIADDGEQEASPIIWNGTMYLSTPHEGVLALDASDGKLLWQTPYNPKYVLLYAVNRGVGLADGKVFIATQDCRVIALSAATGKALWNVQGCRDTSNSFYSSGDGQQPFPAMHLPALQQVTLGAATCAPGREEHARASTIAGSQ